ncbi:MULTISPECIES: DNA polymerase III subunit chi [Pseudomonadaceae]|jgi:hypothetical protein|uniref:DNA polymerase III subunit chi n=1 Tax=Aquipseudomonas alcaligenes TaxID=43263 RepID=A0AB73I1J1_AQUAC|nr:MULTISPECIES: DNA polymerase III subunit chi [Pseudomonas]MDH0143756.1 DNA polymerase III subunit chi [Pseudomonas alcaligenes]NMY43228.1 DNA polymerase III subunit chi [Pseudomonas sp. WS 5013]
MDSSKPPKPDLLLDDLEAIRQLLEKEQLEPPLLTETLDDDLQIPVLSEIIEPGPDAPAAAPLAAVTLSYPVQPAVAPPQPQRPAPATPSAASIGSTVQQSLAAQGKLDAELRAAAQLILQDVIDDFVPQIEAELKRRLDARLDRLLKQPKA